MTSEFTISRLGGGWDVKFHPCHEHDDDNYKSKTSSSSDRAIVLLSIPLSTLFTNNEDAYHAISNSRPAKIALADYTARVLSNLLPIHHEHSDYTSIFTIQTMGQLKHSSNATNNKGSSTKQYGRNKEKLFGTKKDTPIPYVLERSDCIVIDSNNDEEEGNISLQFYLHATMQNNDNELLELKKKIINDMLSPVLHQLQVKLTSLECYTHVACVVLQNAMRDMLHPHRQLDSSISTSTSALPDEKKADGQQAEYLNALAFIADDSLLPRKSGRSSLPMSSPPAVPFYSPENSDQLTRVVTVNVGSFWRRYLNDDGSVKEVGNDMVVSDNDNDDTSQERSTVTMRGMIIPRGVTLIVGGGYHGKSTLLQAITMGIYDNIPHDGRERVVSSPDAVSIRAEDGRYVNNTNVSAFISNLPSGKSINGASISSNQDTTRFSTKDASGSTSQAANVIEAIEGGATTLLVDEDVSAANFMARDGRMRAMIMDEPITPLLYRVNGLFLSKEHEVSTVVVVGGVGEWLDVADAVVLMKDYVAYDGLKKAKSVSYQFSYGHVQYGGRGVVHRLPWKAQENSMKRRTVSDNVDDQQMSDVDDMSQEDNDGKELSKAMTTISPLRRRPGIDCIVNKFKKAAIHLMESGSSHLCFYDDGDCDSKQSAVSNDKDEDDGQVDMSKCSQLVGNSSEQVYGCGICVLWLIQESLSQPDADLSCLLDRMTNVLNIKGVNMLMASLKQNQTAINSAANKKITDFFSSNDILNLWESVGYVYRPRRHEVFMALTRMRGMKFDILPDKPKDVSKVSQEEEVKRLEEEARKKALADLWANRRKK